jgi:RND family efflux transporter MFP subunit
MKHMHWEVPMNARSYVAVVSAALWLLGAGTAFAQTEDLPALDCVINPHKVFDLGSGVRGVLNKVNVELSDYVEANQVVAELDTGVERASVAVAKARAEITSEMLLGQLNLDFDQRRKERIDNLYAAKSVSIQNKEDADLEAELSLQRLQEASERENIRNLELWRAQERLEQKIVRSPGSGFVLKKFKSVGEYIEDQPIVRIAQLDKLSVEVIAPMDLFGKIEVGMLADIYPETQDAKAHRARVSIVDRMGDIASGTFGVRLSLPNADYAIPAGVKCSLQFATEEPGEKRLVSPKQIAKQPKTVAPEKTSGIFETPLWAALQSRSQPSSLSSIRTLDMLIWFAMPAEAAIAPR